MPPSEQVNLCFTAPFCGERIRKKSFCMFVVSPVTPPQTLAIPHSVWLIPRSHLPPHISFICSHSCCWSWEHPYLNLLTLWTCPCASSQHYPWAHPAAPAQPAYIAAIPPYPHLHLLCHTKSHTLPSPLPQCLFLCTEDGHPWGLASAFASAVITDKLRRIWQILTCSY